MPLTLDAIAPDLVASYDPDDFATERYCALASCGTGSECPECCRAMGAGCEHSESHAPGTEPYAAGRDSQGDFACAECLDADSECVAALAAENNGGA